MKKRYLFPLIYIVFFASSFIVPKLGDALIFFEFIIALILLAVSVASDNPKDTYFLVIFGTIIQFYLLGYLWDVIAEKITNRDEKFKVK